jgi:hypothetical protein
MPLIHIHSAVKKTPQVIIPDDSDEDEDEEDDVEDTPAPKRRSQATKYLSFRFSSSPADLSTLGPAKPRKRRQ